MRFEDGRRNREGAKSNVVTMNRFQGRAHISRFQAQVCMRQSAKGMASWVGIHPPVLQVSSPNLDPAIC